MNTCKLTSSVKMAWPAPAPGVEPYIVFDGGPLPAKKGTENERRQKREACANMLAAQGKHSQGTDHYLMCVDVTPEMAYQVIKVRGA